MSKYEITEDQAVVADTEVEIQPEITENPVEEVQEVQSESDDSNVVEETIQPKEDAHKDVLPKGIEKRFAKLTRERYEAQDRIEALERKLHEQESIKNQKPREDFTDDEWIEKVANDKAEALFLARDEEQRTYAKQQQAAAEKQEQWKGKVASMNADIPDFNEVMSRSADVEIPRDVLRTIAESDVGPKIAYHLAKNPSEADKLFSMDTRSRDRYVTRLELKLENTSYAKKEVTKASPTPKARGGSTSNNSEDSLSIDDWMKQRNKKVGR